MRGEQTGLQRRLSERDASERSARWPGGGAPGWREECLAESLSPPFKKPPDFHPSVSRDRNM